MRECKHCENVIDDPDSAIYDGAFWFCDALCQQKYAANLDPLMSSREGEGNSTGPKVKGRYDK